MSSFKRRADQTDLDPIDISTPSSSYSSAFSKLPRRDADEDKSASASASRHSIYTGNCLASAGPSSLSNTASLKHEFKMAEDAHVLPAEPRRDKGKGKMKYLPVLPEEVYRRIWSIYYQDCATRESLASRRHV